MKPLALSVLLLLLAPFGCSGKSDDGGADSDVTAADDGSTGDDTDPTGGTDDTDPGGTDDTEPGGDDTSTSGGDDSGPPERYHAEDYLDPEVHGPDAKLQVDFCTACHGEDLAGGTSGVSCDTCHDGGWRTDCVYCHGGTENETGAPPRDIDDEVEAISFAAHTAHVTTNIHAAYSCEQCHTMPTDVLTPGHLWDGSAAVAEMDFSGGLSPAGALDGAGTASCSNVYCHGTGLVDGSWSEADGAPGCDDCHADMDSPNADLSTMSGEHREHISQNIGCHDCHEDTVERSDDAIKDPALHVNGVVDIALDAGITHNKDGTCTGTCHSENHRDEGW